MVSPACAAKIALQPPPLNVPCPNICSTASFIDKTHCSALGMPVDNPFMVFDPNPAPGKYCYCCCSCFAFDTPIEKSAGSWVMVQDIEAGDTIMAAGADLDWKPGKVRSRSGSTSSAEIHGLFLIFYTMDNEETPRQVLVTPGHLFMDADTRALRPVQTLAPGARLAQADGGVATVVIGVTGDHPVSTSIHTLCMEGDYDGSDLTGHLVNTNGLVSADFEVQARFEAEASGADDTLPEIGSPEYIALHHSDDTVDQLSAMLPKPFAFESGEGLVRVPNAAKRFLTDAEAWHLLASGSFRPLSDASAWVAAQRVIALARTVHSNVLFLIDWRETTPNAYAFVSAGQKFVVITGGFLRLDGVFSDMVLMTAIAMAVRLDGNECVCEADYYAYAYGLRQLVTDTTYVDVVSRALTQSTALFARIETVGGSGSDPCHDPTIECRKLSIANAMSFLGVPSCGQAPTHLELVRATRSGDGGEIDVVFSAAVEKSSAEDRDNYAFIPATAVQSAAVDPDHPTRVTLTVTPPNPSERLFLTVTHVASQDNLPLPEGGGHILVQPA